MKKAISVLLCIALVVSGVFAMAGCTKQKQITNDIVLITDGGAVNDKGYNQSAWDGVNSYANDNKMSARYYQPVLDENGELTSDNIEKYVKLAQDNGAKYIVFPGEKFEVIAYEIASSFPELNFVLVDGIPHSESDKTDRYISNVMCVTFDNLQSGYLAGYIAVKNGNTKLGYFGQYNSDDSANYGAGFAQGAAAAANELGIPVTLDWADYDSPLLNYNYGFTLTACYKKASEVKNKEVFTVKVENGIGSGTYKEGSNVTVTADPAPKGKVFDKWVTKSNTDGVKDKKVNISSKTKSSMNLLVEKCDCTITATYKDAEGAQYDVQVLGADGKSVYSQQYVSENTSVDITAPAPTTPYTVFDHWETDDKDAVEDVNSRSTKVNVTNKDVKLVPVYKQSDTPTFEVKVVTGEGGNGESTGDGYYVEGDKVELSAAVPKEGYMFSHWENKDSYGVGAGIAIENEYYWNTSFDMVDRYASIPEKMFDEGVTLVFAGGNDKEESAYTAKYKFDASPSVVAAGASHDDQAYAVVKNYSEAVQDCLKDFNGGTVIAANCSTDGIYVDGLADGTDEEKAIKESVDNVYKALANGKITPSRCEGGAGYEFCKSFSEKKLSNCFTLNGWFVDATTTAE
jgi:basic membrane lipoprotein Med (substrate-binding protein (PBP1-ABC) superfamily)